MKKFLTEDDTLSITQGSENIFADLQLEDAADLRTKAELTREIYRRIKAFGWTQVDAAKRLGVRQPDVSKLMNARFTGFSVERLISLLTALNVDVEIVLRPRASRIAKEATVRVLAKVA
jgi:predicted XRE-type DNA-binding protein